MPSKKYLRVKFNNQKLGGQDPDELIEAFGMGIGSIQEAAKKVISRKS